MRRPWKVLDARVKGAPAQGFAGEGVRAFELIVNLSNRPGELAALAEKLAHADVNIEGGFMAASDKDGHFEVIFEVADLGAARKALK